MPIHYQLGLRWYTIAVIVNRKGHYSPSQSESINHNWNKTDPIIIFVLTLNNGSNNKNFQIVFADWIVYPSLIKFFCS